MANKLFYRFLTRSITTGSWINASETTDDGFQFFEGAWNPSGSLLELQDSIGSMSFVGAISMFQQSMDTPEIEPTLITKIEYDNLIAAGWIVQDIEFNNPSFSIPTFSDAFGTLSSFKKSEDILIATAGNLEDWQNWPQTYPGEGNTWDLNVTSGGIAFQIGASYVTWKLIEPNPIVADIEYTSIDDNIEIGGEADLQGLDYLIMLTSGGLEIGGEPIMVLSADVSGIYFLDPGHTHDTLYQRDGEAATINTKIPDPFASTALLNN